MITPHTTQKKKKRAQGNSGKEPNDGMYILWDGHNDDPKKWRGDCGGTDLGSNPFPPPQTKAGVVGAGKKKTREENQKKKCLARRVVVRWNHWNHHLKNLSLTTDRVCMTEREKRPLTRGGSLLCRRTTLSFAPTMQHSCFCGWLAGWLVD